MDKHWIAQATSWLKASRHSRVIFEEGGLLTEATIRQYRIVAPEVARTLVRLGRYRRTALAKAAVFGTILPDTPAMPLCDAHFGGFFIVQTPIDMANLGLAIEPGICIITSNNTPQASPSDHRREAQTGGFLFSGVGYEI